jgi:hypothetical protein
VLKQNELILNKQLNEIEKYLSKGKEEDVISDLHTVNEEDEDVVSTQQEYQEAILTLITEQTIR